MKEIRNKTLYYFIVKNYCHSDNPMQINEIATVFDISVGAIKNFMYRHNLNKKGYYKKKQKRMIRLREAGLTYKEIGNAMGLTCQAVATQILKGSKNR